MLQVENQANRVEKGRNVKGTINALFQLFKIVTMEVILRSYGGDYKVLNPQSLSLVQNCLLFLLIGHLVY